MNSKAIVSGALILLVGNVLSSLLGLVREMLMAAHYGTGIDMDAYLFALTIPGFLLTFASGIYSSGFIPLYIKEKVDSGEEKASLLYSNSINLSLLLLAVVTAGCYLGSEYLAGAFAIDAAAQDKIMRLLWILLPSMFFFTLSYAQSMVLNSVNHFTMPALLTVLNNIVVIGFMLALHRSLGIYSAAIGYVLGTALQFAVQLPVMRRYKLKYRFYLSFKDESVRRLARISIPIAGLVLIDQCTVLASRFFASSLEPGSASAINYASRLVMLPVTLFGTAIISSAFPSAVQMQAENKLREYGSVLSATVKSMILLLAPVAVLCASLSPDIIRAMLERGAFDTKATAMTATAFAIAAIGIPMFPVRDFFVKLLISRGNNRAPIVSTALYGAVFVAGCFALVPLIQYKAIAVANIAALVASLVYLLIAFGRQGRDIPLKVPLSFLLKVGASTGLSAIGALVFRRECLPWAAAYVPDTVATILTLALGMGLYALLAKLMKVEEIAFVYDKLTARFRPGKRREASA